MRYTPKYIIALIIFIAWWPVVNTYAQPAKRLYIANDDHTDYMWSGNEAQYDSAFVKMLDFQLAKIEATKNELPDFQTRYNCDGSYWINTYQKYRSESQFNQLMNAMKSGHISSQMNSVVSCYGAQPTEAAIRGMYYAGHLERKYSIRFTMATAMENNTVPLGLSSLWAGCGVKYSWKGVGGYGTQLPQESLRHRKHLLYRYAGLDGSSVLMKWYPLKGNFGGYAECRVTIKSKTPIDTANDIGKVINSLDALCDTISATSIYPYQVAGAFGFGHDDLSTFVAEPFTKAAKAATNNYRTVRVSNEEDFFTDVEKTYPALPSQSVSYGNEWDLLSASMNETTAEVRRATEKLRIAEALAAIVSLKAPAFADQLVAARNLAWDAFGLYWEHNWTADGPVPNKTRGAWQIKIKDQITDYVDSLYNLAIATLASQLKQSANKRFFVFNPLSWLRNDIADIAFGENYPVKVIEVTTGKEVPHQVITKDGQQFIRIAATGIPSVGYKVYEIRRGNSISAKPAAVLDGEYISNLFYKIRFAPSGVITEIVDKKNGKQWVQETDKKFVNDLGTSDINDGNKIEIENSGPVSVTFKAVSGNPIIHTTRITLFANNPRIDIENSIDTNFTDNKTWAFSFNLKDQTVHHEELGAILTVKKKSRGGHYADENARYDWQTFNHFADMSNAANGITLSNLDCSFFKLGKSTVDSLWENSTQLSALAGGQIDKKKEDGGVLGIHRQLGQNHFHYHFALLPHANAFNATAAMKFALAHQNPLITGMLTGGANANAITSFSLLHINHPDVLLWSVKPSEEGAAAGLITRFWNLKNEAVQPTITLNQPVRRAWQTTHIETDTKTLQPVNGSIKVHFTPQQINTFRLDINK